MSWHDLSMRTPGENQCSQQKVETLSLLMRLATWLFFIGMRPLIELKGRLHDRAKMARIQQKLERFQ